TRNLESLRMENLSNVASKVRKSDPVQRAIILFEHSLVGEGQLSFLDFIAKRIQPISIVLDQIFFEQDLHSTSYLWEQSFDCIEEPIAIVDREFQLLKANRNFTKSKTGIHCHEAFFESSETCLGCPVKQVIEKGIPHTSLLKKCNHVFQVRSYPIRDARKTGFSGTIVNHYLDVTKAQALRTQVAQSEKMAAVGHLAGHIAHELNNPLTGIRSTAQILLHDRKPGTSLYDDLVEVEKATLRCQNIIRNLLEFSHEGSESVLTLVSLNDVLEKTLPLLKSAMGLFENEIDLTSESTLVKVEPQLLQQVIFNILNNACQAIEGKGKIYISTHLEIEEGLEFVDLRIRDTGRGMALEVQEFIFDPFFTTKAVGQGTGLGLSMSKRVVESFGGKIWVWSQAGEGTEFTVRLPSGRNSA
ncbi:MAG: hypothetical protein KDD35_09455, partial [Bdellovibrionales bacterium]|nr:hypothetical protein [Bdellovibrionales bacterium]